jgi:hypothetical protein
VTFPAAITIIIIIIIIVIIIIIIERQPFEGRDKGVPRVVVLLRAVYDGTNGPVGTHQARQLQCGVLQMHLGIVCIAKDGLWQLNCLRKVLSSPGTLERQHMAAVQVKG